MSAHNATDSKINDKLQKSLHTVKSYINKNLSCPFTLSAEISDYTDCKVCHGAVESINCGNDYEVFIEAFIGNKKGGASCNSFAAADLIKTAQTAFDLANIAQEDKCLEPVATHLLATKFPDLEIYNPTDLPIEKLIEFAKENEQTAIDYDSKITNSEGVGIYKSTTHQIYANDKDFCATNAYSAYSISASVIASTAKQMQSGSYWSRTINGSQLFDFDSIGKTAAKHAISSLNPQSIKTGKYPVLFIPELASGLLRSFLQSISGHRVYKKTTFLLDKLGETIFPNWFSLVESPFLKSAWGSSHFDGEGVARMPKVIIEQGKLNNYLFDCYSANKLNQTTTGNAGGVSNIEITNSNLNFKQLQTQMQTGIIVTQLMGDGINLVTGDYSQGAKGFFVENGKIKHPVDSITISGNLTNMAQQLLACGTDIDHRFNILTGSWLIDDMVVGA